MLSVIYHRWCHRCIRRQTEACVLAARSRIDAELERLRLESHNLARFSSLHADLQAHFQREEPEIAEQALRILEYRLKRQNIL